MGTGRSDYGTSGGVPRVLRRDIKVAPLTATSRYTTVYGARRAPEGGERRERPLYLRCKLKEGVPATHRGAGTPSLVL